MKRFLSRLKSFMIKSKPERTLSELYPQYDFGRGTYCRGAPKLKVLSWHKDERLRVGNFCSIAVDTTIILGGNHRPDWVTTYPFNKLWEAGAGIDGSPRSKGDVIIGNDVWIGHGATILSGVTIHDGAVIGANAVVSNDVPAYAIVVGNPARIVKRRFDEDIINRLLEVEWWNGSDEQISEMIPSLLSNNIEGFLDTAEGQNGAG